MLWLCFLLVKVPLDVNRSLILPTNHRLFTCFQPRITSKKQGLLFFLYLKGLFITAIAIVTKSSG